MSIETSNSNAQRDEISLFDVLIFFINSWKVIFLSTVLGFIFALIYTEISPKKFEAKALVLMAQVYPVRKFYTDSAFPVEDPANLIARMSFLTALTSEQKTACSNGRNEIAGNDMTSMFKLSTIKDVRNAVELKAYGGSPEDANRCLVAIFELIKLSQQEMVTPYLDEVDILRDADKLNSYGGTQFMAPVYINESPIEPKKFSNLISGLTYGFFFGILFLLSQKLIFQLTGLYQAIKNKR